jgi:hypothetical protein
MNELKYNGWKNYQTWNVALWIQNDQSLYELAKLCTDYKDFIKNLDFEEINLGTPDGISWCDTDLDISELNKLIRNI